MLLGFRLGVLCLDWLCFGFGIWLFCLVCLGWLDWFWVCWFLWFPLRGGVCRGELLCLIFDWWVDIGFGVGWISCLVWGTFEGFTVLLLWVGLLSVDLGIWCVQVLGWYRGLTLVVVGWFDCLRRGGCLCDLPCWTFVYDLIVMLWLVGLLYVVLGCPGWRVWLWLIRVCSGWCGCLGLGGVVWVWVVPSWVLLGLDGFGRGRLWVDWLFACWFCWLLLVSVVLFGVD